MSDDAQVNDFRRYKIEVVRKRKWGYNKHKPITRKQVTFLRDIVDLKYEEEDLKLLAGFTLLDDDFMTIVFDRNIGATELVLSIILGRDDMKVMEVVAQREYKNPVTDGRSIKLDIYAKDADGKVYDIEVQNEDAGADVHRARFHSSMLDIKMLKTKQRFKEIHDSYVIFIIKNDYMKMGLAMYHVERIVQEAGTLFGDGSHIIYVNGNYKNTGDPIGKLIHDLRCTSAVDMFYPERADPVRHFKETEGGRRQVCKAMEERIDRERIETLFDIVNNLMKTMEITAEQAMTAMCISDDDRAILSKRF